MSGNTIGCESKEICGSSDQDGGQFPLTIASHVYVCATGDGSVILDLKRDRYLGLGREETELVSKMLDAWPKPKWSAGKAPGCDEDAVAVRARTETLCQSLIEYGLLTSAGGVFAGDARAPLPDMRREWISVGDELEAEGRVTGQHVTNFVLAFIWVRLSLTFLPLQWTVRAIQARKARHRRSGELISELEVAALVSAFRVMRPFVFAAEGRCLLHALVLTKYLSRYDFYPDWVIGVATQPWAAHSWVQWGNLLLDCNPEKVCRYTPILMV